MLERIVVVGICEQPMLYQAMSPDKDVGRDGVCNPFFHDLSSLLPLSFQRSDVSTCIYSNGVFSSFSYSDIYKHCLFFANCRNDGDSDETNGGVQYTNNEIIFSK